MTQVLWVCSQIGVSRKQHGCQWVASQAHKGWCHHACTHDDMVFRSAGHVMLQGAQREPFERIDCVDGLSDVDPRHGGEDVQLALEDSRPARLQLDLV